MLMSTTAVTCGNCEAPIAVDGPSPDFCGEACQKRWHAPRLVTCPCDPMVSGLEVALDRYLTEVHGVIAFDLDPLRLLDELDDQGYRLVPASEAPDDAPR